MNPRLPRPNRPKKRKSGPSRSTVAPLGSGSGTWSRSCASYAASSSGASGRAEVDFLGLDRAGRPSGRRLVLPVQVRVRDHLLRWGRAPLRLVLGRVGVADQGRVVPSDERAVERRADALIRLGAGDDEPSDTEAGQHRLEGRVLERVAIALLDE